MCRSAGTERINVDEEIFADIPEFPLYMVSNYGTVVHYSSRIMTHSPTQYGDLTVGMMKDGRQYRRSVKVLVARAFVPGESRMFDTPILLDGDHLNLHHSNIVWRPRWFAVVYYQQFKSPPANADVGPIMNMHTEEIYDNVCEAAMATGSLIRDIRSSLLNQTRVFPDGSVYRFI